MRSVREHSADVDSLRDLLNQILAATDHEEVPHAHATYSGNCIGCRVQEVIFTYWYGSDNNQRRYITALAS